MQRETEQLPKACFIWGCERPEFRVRLYPPLGMVVYQRKLILLGSITKKRYSFGEVLSPDAKVLAATTALVLQIRGPSSASRQCFGIRICRAFL